MTYSSVIITGGAQGIGLAVVERCLRDGYNVIACDIDEKALDRLRAAHSRENISTFSVDVSDYAQADALFRELEAKGEYPSCLVNNAGIYLGKDILEYSPEEIDRVIATNILGSVYFSQMFGKALRTRSMQGSIVNISSVAGEEGGSDAIYSLTKAALIGLTKSCAMNFAPHIRVNAIAPTLVNTDLIRRVPQSRVDDYRKNELLKDPILPEDVANTVAFLLGDQSRHYTGAVLDLNNGVYRR
jgi:3-oxoacyl-[acyl-carrier protein] reductase